MVDFTTRRFILSALCCFCAFLVQADIKILSPENGATVSQLYPVQAQLVGETMPEREKYFDGGVNAKRLKDAGCKPKPVELRWQGGVAPFKLTVRRLPDGKVFLDTKVDGNEAQIDSLETGREWEWTVCDTGGSAKGVFKTEDKAPRLININGAVNVRDIGGWKGLDGRRIRQGLLFRSAGLNRNAPIEYYSLAEVKDFHAQGRLAGMGDAGKKHAKALDAGEALTDKDIRLVKRSCFAPGRKTLTKTECCRLQSLYGFKTDLDLRRADEVYGMDASPLGPAVNWVNISLIGGYSGFSKEATFECKRRIFKTIFDRNSYPIIVHCIAGADRTGMISFMVEALLGADDNTLTLDYLVTGLASGVTDSKHKGWFDSMMRSFKALPGETNAEKMNGMFLRMGFTQREIDDFREFMLEP
jgi:protein-tyrosine phosphatase